MGTSSMYLGPNRSPLLPPDFDNGDNPNNPDSKPDEKSPNEQNEPTQEPQQTNSSNENQNSNWTQAKKSMSKYASGNGGSNGRKVAVREYV